MHFALFSISMTSTRHPAVASASEKIELTPTNHFLASAPSYEAFGDRVLEARFDAGVKRVHCAYQIHPGASDLTSSPALLPCQS